MNKKIRNGLLLCIAAVAAGGVSFCGASVYRSRAEQVAPPLPAATAESAVPASQAPAADLTAAPAAEPIPIDFAAEQKECADIYAWLEIPGTKITQPVVQHPTDDNYYLDYTIDGVKWTDGAIYTELCTAKDFSDFNTVIYGHNMTDDTMFGGLSAYLDAAYLQAHREIVIYTPSEKRVYRIFAAVVYDDRYLPYAFDQTDPDDCQLFIDSLSETGNENSQVLDDVPVGPESKLLTLSTCYGGRSYPNNRYLIVAAYEGA